MKAIVNGRLVFPERIVRGNLLIEGDKIVAAGYVQVPEGAEIIDAGGLYVGPGFVDQHSHGYQQYGEAIPAKDDPAGAAAGHLKHGTTTYIPSTDYADSLEEHEYQIKRSIDAIEHDPDTSIMGIHLEGPFINKKYGSESYDAMEYSDEICERLFTLASPYVRQCTYAPELPTAIRVEERMRRYGIPAAIGHTCAGPDDLERAVAYGARIATHLYDAMAHYRGLEEAAKITQHPQDCTSNVLLSIPGLYYELICDSQGLHVTKNCVCEALRAAGEDHIILISDAFVVESAVGGARDVNYDADGTLCGSRMCIAMAARNFINFTGADIRVTFKCASTNSAKAMGLYDKVGSIEAGRFANIVMVDPDFHVRRIFFKGNEITEVRD